MKARFCVAVIAVQWMLAILVVHAQAPPTERTFPQSKTVVEAAVRQLQGSSGGHLPVLDGFAVAGEQPLDRFQKGYYQCAIQVTSTPTGGSVVRVSAKITAWYNAPVAAKSGYQVLASNGRLESDLLDRLADALGAAKASTPGTSSAGNANLKANTKDSATSGSSTLNLPSAPSFKGNAFPRTDRGQATPPRSSDPHSDDLDKEARNLAEILRNQSHPTNLAAVRKSGTPVLVSPSEGAKVLFLADAEDEFEILDSNESWVHVRISGLSRAWIRRSGLEMPDSSDSADAPPEAPPAPATSPAAPVANDQSPFQIENEQTASFPGDWQPLRGKVVRIVSIQKIAGSSADSGSQAKQAFVKGLLNKEYADLTQTSSTAAGIVLVFDSVDGGMVAATLPVLREWKSGTLSDEALWRRCYVDPPEMFGGGAGQ
jgi:hypothetical protein